MVLSVLRSESVEESDAEGLVESAEVLEMAGLRRRMRMQKAARARREWS